mgnify:FL=1
MTTTTDNLKEAFAGESQAFQKYTAFAQKAERDGFANIARLFRLTAQAEQIHAAGHLNALEGVGSTADNLQAAINGETFETEKMYPPMLAQAEAEGHKAKRMFKYAVEAEEVHAKLYAEALAAVQAGKDLDVDFYLCPVCGYIEFEQAPENCPVCGAKGSKFIKG